MTRPAGSTARSRSALPSVERLASRLEVPHAIAVRAARAAIDAARERVVDGGVTPPFELLAADAAARAAALEQGSLRRVVNATGVIIHTNLGRAPLAPEALAALSEASGYSNLEFDLESGTRGSRQAHVDAMLCELTGTQAALCVNNGAAAVLLACAALASGREVVVSRGQLVEIGGSFRIPDVIAHSGARLVEVGTTNRTRLRDYERAIRPETAALLRAHQSNFRTVGFVAQVAVEDLCVLARERGIAMIDDVGSGAIAERLPELADEPAVQRSVAAGCDVVCFSGDKLLGGPQAGVMVGMRAAIERCREHPLARALRIDKLSLAALEATLRLYRDPIRALERIPVLRMLSMPETELRARAERMRARLAGAGVKARVDAGLARAGGGALPLVDLPGAVCAVDPGPVGCDELARRLRRMTPPVVGRVREGLLLLDPRTLEETELDVAADAVARSLAP